LALVTTAAGDGAGLLVTGAGTGADAGAGLERLLNDAAVANVRVGITGVVLVTTLVVTFVDELLLLSRNPEDDVDFLWPGFATSCQSESLASSGSPEATTFLDAR
jgi:carbon starvation protein CstA